MDSARAFAEQPVALSAKFSIDPAAMTPWLFFNISANLS